MSGCRILVGHPLQVYRLGMHVKLVPLAILPVLLFSFTKLEAQILPLDFTGGNGTSLVDQYAGTAGSGWSTPWTQVFGADTSSTSASVVNATPIYSGGDNYLQVGFNTGTGTSRGVRVSRQWNTSALSLTAPFTIDFYFRSNTIVSNANQSFILFGSSAATSGTGTNDSWKISIDGSGISVYNGNTGGLLASAAAAGTNVANTPLHFTLAINPVTDTYTVSATRLDTNATFTSGTLALRNGNNPSLSYFNFVSNAGPSLTGAGFALDGIAVVPEPGTTILLASGALAGMLGWRRRGSVGR